MTATVMTVMTAALLGACSSGPAGSAAPAEQSDTGTQGQTLEPMTITLGHTGGVEDNRQKASLMLAERAAELTGGGLTIEVFPAGQLGSWEEMQEGLEVGSVDVVLESVGSLERYSALASIEGLPFLYDDPEHFLEVWDSPLAEEILDALAEESGFRLIGKMYRGARLLNTVRPIASLSDLTGLKLRVPTQQTYIDTWQALGASPTPMAYTEVFTALEQGAIDGQENPIDIIRFDSMYEVAPFITETRHLYGNYHFQVWEESFLSWPQEYRDAFLEAAGEVSEWYGQDTIDRAVEHKEFLEGEGVEFFSIDVGEWREKVLPLYDDADPRVLGWVERIESRDY